MDYVILGGNMRFRAMQEAGWKKVYVRVVDWSKEKQREFIIKDNIANGEWAWELLANEWDKDELVKWGFEEANFEQPEGWNPDKTYDDKIGDGIGELVGYGLQSFWKDIKNKNCPVFKHQIDLPVQEKQNVVRQRYSRTNLEEIQRIVKTYMREGDYFLESCVGWATFSSVAKYFGYSGVGIDIWDKSLQHSKDQLMTVPGKGRVKIRQGDAMDLQFNDETFDYVYCNPPFMDAEKYSGADNDISTKDDDAFAAKFTKLMSENFRVLKQDKLCTITINDNRKKGLLNPLQAKVINWGLQVGFNLHDFVVAEVLSQKIRLRKKDYEKRRTVKCHEYVITFIKTAQNG